MEYFLAEIFNISIPNPISNGDFWQILTKVYDYLIYLAIPVAILLIIYSGFRMMTAKGDPAKFKDGGKTLKWTVIGLFVILAARYLPSLVRAVLEFKDK